MIKLRTMATAFLTNNEDFLLMKRSMERKFAPGLWAGVGGHLEPDEINNPGLACIREVHEETGLTEEDIFDLKLKYIILRRSKDEIRVSYIYFGRTNVRELKDTDEGDLFWINRNELFDRKLSIMNEVVLKHYLEFNDQLNEEVLVGTLNSKNGEPIVNWSPVQDWEGL